MKIMLKGQTSPTKAIKHIKDTINEVLEHSGLPTGASFKLEDLECKVVFTVDGEQHYLTVNHEGLTELFTLLVKLDKKGNREKCFNNDKKSFNDDFTRSVVNGEEKTYPAIVSVYKDEDLKEVGVTDGGDIREVVYTHKLTGERVIRYYKNNSLIGEIAI